MSIDLFVHSSRTSRLRQDKLSVRLSKKSWHVLFVDPSGDRESKAGRVGNHLIYGARTPKQRNEIRDLVRSHRQSDIDGLYENEALAVCELIGSSPSNPEEPDESLPCKLINRLKATKVFYSLRTPAGRTGLSVKCQNAVWEAIGRLTGGVLEDPQEASYFTLGAKGRKILWKSEDAPIDVLGIFFKAAKAKGFPVEMMDGKDNQEILFHPERLSEVGLKRFLNFTKHHRWPYPEYGSGMIGMILDEYRFRKGPEFVRAKSKWLNDLEKKYCGSDEV